MAFSTHDVIVTGARLDALLPDIAIQRMTLLREPLRSDSFAAVDGLRVTGITVKKAERRAVAPIGKERTFENDSFIEK